jgi:hypothetical protein
LKKILERRYYHVVPKIREQNSINVLKWFNSPVKKKKPQRVEEISEEEVLDSTLKASLL